MPPSAPLADPGEAFPALEPAEVIHDVDPRAVAIDEDRLHGAGARVTEVKCERILKSVEVLEHDVVRLTGPVHARDVVVPRVARDRQPPRFPAAGTHDAHTRRGVRRPR